jgi:hypothetical protein
MKPETNNEKKYSLNISKPEIIDDFWKDCIDQKEKRIIKNKLNQKNNKLFINTENDQTNKQKLKYYLSNKLPDSKSNKNINTTQNNKRINEKNEKYLMKIIKKHPSFIEEMKNEEIKKIKRKNALNRCLGLYSYGLELQKNLKLNKENNELQKKKNDISLCTFKPKINKKILYLDDKILEVKYNKVYNNPNQNKPSNDNSDNSDINNKPLREKVKSVEHVRNNNYIKKNKELEECTFKPKFVKDPSEMEKMLKHRRKNKKSISERRENEEFILRYTKARDEYLIKRFKKLNKKDDSYDNSLLSLTKRLCNRQYKNYLNVNNTILLFGETINTINTNNYINSSIADFRGLTIANTVPERKKQKIDYVIGLRKNLHNIDLNESENEQ